jgi:hypothetical protein
MRMKKMLNDGIKYTILYCVFVITFVIPFYYGSGTVINYGSGSTLLKVTVPTVPVPHSTTLFPTRFYEDITIRTSVESE